ncbi:LysE family transporter [Candidatus Woesearchaeota archaeon]|nr:LysE family transporter [Candidatus Woesearchaeota archaeon]
MGVFESLVIGISIAAIPGPIFFELLRRTLAKGFWSGALLSVGEFLGNLTLLLLIFFGISNFLVFKVSKAILYLAGASILIWLGVDAFRLNKHEIEESYRKKITKNNSIAVGFGIAVSSPIVIALWISLSGSYLAQFNSPYFAFLNIFLIAFGFIIFFFTLAAIIHYTRHKIPPEYIILLSKIFGIVLIFYGAYFILKFCNLM